MVVVLSIGCKSLREQADEEVHRTSRGLADVLRERSLKPLIAVLPIQGTDCEILAGIDLRDQLDLAISKQGYETIPAAQIMKWMSNPEFAGAKVLEDGAATRLGKLAGAGVVILGAQECSSRRCNVTLRIFETATGLLLREDDWDLEVPDFYSGLKVTGIVVVGTAAAVAGTTLVFVGLLYLTFC